MTKEELGSLKPGDIVRFYKDDVTDMPDSKRNWVVKEKQCGYTIFVKNDSRDSIKLDEEDLDKVYVYVHNSYNITVSPLGVCNHVILYRDNQESVYTDICIMNNELSCSDLEDIPLDEARAYFSKIVECIDHYTEFEEKYCKVCEKKRYL